MKLRLQYGYAGLIADVLKLGVESEELVVTLDECQKADVAISSALKPRHQEIIRRAYGLGVPSQNLNVLGEQQGVTGTRIGQILRRCSEHLRTDPAMWEVALTNQERDHNSEMLADLAEGGKTLRVVQAVHEGWLSPCELYSHRTEHVLYALPIRTRNHFVNNAGRTIAKLLAKKRKDLQRSPGIGPGMMRELEDELVQLGLTLGALVEE